nr:hypothetical protein [Bdellovibrionales bacterium]
EDQWKVSHTIEQTIATEEPKAAAFDVRNHLNPLDQEVSDWGMSIPGVINDDQSHEKKIDLPSVIDEVKAVSDIKPKVEAKPEVKAAAPSSTTDIKFPETDDLDYPTIEQLNETNAPVAEAKPAPKSKLISIESFNPAPEMEFEIEHSINSMEETDVSSIEAQIRDEVEEDLWKVDEFEDLKKEVASKIEEVKNNFQPSSKDFDETLFKPLDEHEEIKWTTSDNFSFESHDEPVSPVAPAQIQKVDMQELRSEMEEMIKKHVKEYMDEMFKQKVEKISWEIIPDLAENLIRQEMTKISNKILNESN